MKYDFNDIKFLHLFEWGELNYLQMEQEIGIEAFRILNANQEAALRLTKEKFEKALLG